MKKNHLFLICLISISSVYADSGLYLGIGAGYASTDSKTTNGFSYLDGSSEKNGGNMLGNLYVGYDFNRYVGLQADYYYIAGIPFNDVGSNIPGIQGSFSVGQQTLALGITGHLPFELFANSLSGLSLFGKLAMGYNTFHFSGGNVANYDKTYIASLPSTDENLSPIFGGGVEYGFDSVGIRAEYERIGSTPVGNDNQNMLSIDNNMYLISAFYHF